MVCFDSEECKRLSSLDLAFHLLCFTSRRAPRRGICWNEVVEALFYPMSSSFSFFFLNLGAKEEIQTASLCVSNVPSVTDERASMECRSVLASQIAHCSASMARENISPELWIPFMAQRKLLPTNRCHKSKAGSLPPWIQLSRSPIARSLWSSGDL